jgi:hypothetical protein
MNDPRRHEQTGRQGAEPAVRLHQPYPAYADPAYADQSAYARPQSSGATPNQANHPTVQLPRSCLQDQPASDQPQQLPPDRPKTPRWLWVAAAAAVALVIVMVIALVISNGSAKDQAVVSPLPGMPNSMSPASTTSATPSPTTSSPPGTSLPESGAGALDPVVYSVTGQGHAISITYRDSGDVIATEFNVALPWSKEVSLPKSGKNANVTIVNIGYDVTCTLTVAGEQVRQHTGAGLTICDAPA